MVPKVSCEESLDNNATVLEPLDLDSFLFAVSTPVKAFDNEPLA